MRIASVSAAQTAAEFAKVGDFNDYLRTATDEELAMQAVRIENELKDCGETRNHITDVLKDRLQSLNRVLGLAH